MKPILLIKIPNDCTMETLSDLQSSADKKLNEDYHPIVYIGGLEFKLLNGGEIKEMSLEEFKTFLESK